jgi:hypothetical protein
MEPDNGTSAEHDIPGEEYERILTKSSLMAYFEEVGAAKTGQEVDEILALKSYRNNHNLLQEHFKSKYGATPGLVTVKRERSDAGLGMNEQVETNQSQIRSNQERIHRVTG